MPRVDTHRREVAAAELMPLLAAAGLVLASGLLISLYSIVLRQAALRAGSQDSLVAAAQAVGKELQNIVVEDPSFGPVGVCDTDKTTSLNRLYATLRVDNFVANELPSPVMKRLVESDFNQVQNLDNQLREKLSAAVADGSGPVYKLALKLASVRNRANENLVGLRLKLGYIKSRDFDSGMPVNGYSKEEQAFTANGKILPGVKVPITGSNVVSFYPLASENRVVDPSNFVEAGPDMAPSAVLIEAVFQKPGPASPSEIAQRKFACIQLGGINLAAPHSVLMVGFPQGMPSGFCSLRSLSNAAGQSNVAWQQAVDGNVPGNGHFVVASSNFGAYPQMRAQDAIQASFYHWIRSLGPTPNIASIEKIFNESWSTIAVQPIDKNDPNKGQNQPNSALTKNTGACSLAYFYQCGPGGVGQNVLRSAFEAQPIHRGVPRSALPLNIDQNGTCTLPGHNRFDMKLVSDMLEGLYETNVLANESLGVAKSVITRMERAEDQTKRNIDLTTEELSSITDRRVAQSSKEEAAEVKRLIRTEQELTETINGLRAKLTEYSQVKERANAVLNNAEAAAQASFDMCANMSNYAEDGIWRGEDDTSFVLGNLYIFHPLTHSVTEDEIYKGTAGPVNWTKPGLLVLEEASPKDAQRNALQSDASEESRAKPRFVLLDSHELTAQTPRILVLDRSPFADTGVPVGQLSFYGQDSLTTGQEPAVGWSVLVRDVVASRGYGGVPLPSRQTKWCLGNDRAVSECPGLAVEVQVRSPVPLIPNLPVGSFVVNPTNHERVSQIPPMPPNML